MDTVPVGARIVHPLGVVPETAVDCVQSAGVLELLSCICCFFFFFLFGHYSDRADLTEWIPFQWEHA